MLSHKIRQIILQCNYQQLWSHPPNTTNIIFDTYLISNFLKFPYKYVSTAIAIQC